MLALSPLGLLLILGLLVGLGSAVAVSELSRLLAELRKWFEFQRFGFSGHSSFGVVIKTGPPKQISPHQARQVAKVGQSKKKFLCPVDADPPPIFIQWLKDGDPVSDVWTRFRVNDNDGSLRIKDIELEDAGKYVCKATNGFGSIMVNYSLIVVDKESGMVKMDNNNLFTQEEGEDLTKEGVSPHFMEEQKMLRNSAVVRPVGSSVRLRCRADGNPPPHVLWIRDSIQGKVTLESTEDEEDSNKRKWTLKLRNLQEEDSGTYVCKVTNRLGTINFTYSLEVIGKMKTKPVLIGPHPENETVVLGGVASFQCKVKSVVTPHIQWLKRLDVQTEDILNNSAIIEVKGQKFSVLKTGEVWKDTEGFYLNKLIIRNILPSDAGMYICLGANTMGYSFRSAFLTVSSKPVIKPDREIKQHSVDISSKVQIEMPAQSADQDGASSENDASSDGSLPLMIAIPAGVAIIAVTIAICILQRRRCFNARSNSHRTTRFNPVPQQEQQTFPTPVHTNPHMLPPSAPTSIRTGDKVSNNRSLDFYSDISSVSRCHHQQQHNNLQYGY